MRTDPKVPACWKSSRTSSSVAWNERFPTKSFVNIAATSCRAQDRVSLFPVRLEPEEEPGHFPPKCSVPRAHPCRLVDVFGEVHDPRLKPEGLVETVGDLAEMMVHDRLLAWRGPRHVHQRGRRATLQESCAIATMHDELRQVPELVRHPAGAKRGASFLVSARKLPSSSSRCSISRAREREWDIRRRQSVSSVILSSFVRSLR